MNCMKSYFGMASFVILAVASGATQATTFQAGYAYTGPGGPQGYVTANTTGTSEFISSQTMSICGGGYYRTCEGSATSSPLEFSTFSRNSGIGYMSTTAGFVDTWTNTSGHTQSYTFDFHLANADLYIRDTYGENNGRPMDLQPETGFSARILVNGVSVWDTSRSLLLDGNGPHLFTSGADIGSGLPGNLPFFSYSYDYSGSVNLGSFDAGSSFSIEYELSSYANNRFDPGNCGWECLEVSARIGDPFALNAASAIHEVSAVPEPETYALFLTGLAAMGAVIRRKNKKTHTSNHC